MTIRQIFQDLNTPQIADACVRLQLPMKVAPSGIKPLAPHMKLAGPALPVRHFGSVDVFIEACSVAHAGDVLIIDDGGRDDQGCIGDLTAHEARASGLGGIVVWGSHRDTQEILDLDFPVFSYGSYPVGPLTVHSVENTALTIVKFGDHNITRADFVFGDADGVIFVHKSDLPQIIEMAQTIHDTERRQVERLNSGELLRDQLKLADYLQRKETDPAYLFRDHLRSIGGAMEE